MSSFKVLDEKFTRPSGLSRDVRKFTSQILAELLPAVQEKRSTDFTIKIQKKDSCKRKFCSCACDRRDHRSIENSLCEIFKKIRLDCDDPNEQQVKRITHSANCQLTKRGCCSRQMNFAGANKSLVVNENNLKLSKIPVRVSLDNSQNKSPMQSKIPIPTGASANKHKSAANKSVIKRKGLSTPRQRSSTLKSCLKQESKISPYVDEIMNTFPNYKRHVSFSEFIEDDDTKCAILENDRKRGHKQSLGISSLSLPPWRY